MSADIRSMTLEELTEALGEMGEPAFRGRQVFAWLHRGVRSFDEMSDISKSLRERLGERFSLSGPAVARKQVSQADGTVKYLWEFPDGNCIETVLMGIGEPMDNLDNVLRFLELVNHPQGLNIGMRHISLSTCGVIPGIRRLAELGLQLTLSVSLHAPDSETRSRIMPVNRAYDVEALFGACHEYFQRTGRRISFEYAMIDGVNDADWQADLIVRRLRGMPGHVNLIPLNDVSESPFKPSRRTRQFQRRLESQGVAATVRRSLGGDIDASCGQLRRKAMEKEGQ